MNRSSAGAERIERDVPRTEGKGPQAGAEQPDGGWDPYEVWRTRVLLPRIESVTGEEQLPPGPEPQ